MKRAVLFFAAVTACSLSAASVDLAGTRLAPALTTEAGWTSVRLDASNIVGLVSGGSELYALAGGTRPSGLYASTDSGKTWVLRLAFGVWAMPLRGIAFGGRTLLVWSDSYLFRSTDRGRTLTVSDIPVFVVQSMASTGPRDFVGFGTSLLPYPQAPALVRSSDEGRSWTTTRLPRPGETGLRLSVSPLNRSVMFAVTRLASDPSSCRVLRSLDGGARWRDVTGVIGTSMPIHDVAADAGDPKRVWVAAFSGLYRSDDLGLTWHGTPGLRSVWRVVSDPRLPGSVLAAGVGKTWRVGGEGSAIWMMPPATGVRGIPSVLLPLDKGDLLGGTAGVFRQVSSIAWSGSSSGLTTRIVRPIAISRSDSKVAYASIAEDGIYRSQDAGISWTRLPDHPWIRSLAALRVDPTNSDLVYAAGEYGVFRSKTGGQSWNRILEGRCDLLEIDPAAPLRLIAGGPSWSRTVNVSVDGGSSWTRTLLPEEFTPLSTLAFGPGSTVFAGGSFYEDHGPGDETSYYGYLARSDDNGRAWRRVSDRLVSELQTSPAKPQRLYMKNENNEMFVSDDGGSDWRPLPRRSQEGADVRPWAWNAFLGTQDRILAVDGDGAVYSWADGETFWSRISPAWGSPYYVSFAWDPGSGLVLLNEQTDLRRRTGLVAR